MSEKVRGSITATAKYHPEKIVTNDQLAEMVDTSDEWIRTRTGIEERRRAKPGQASSDLATLAVQQILKKREVSPEEIDAIIVATVTPDMLFPSTACLIQSKIGAKNAYGFDVSAACSGFLYALSIGDQFVQSGRHKKVLVVGVDVMSSILNYQDRNTCVLFGDGAGVVLIEPEPEGSGLGIIDYINRSDGDGGKFLFMPAGGSSKPASHETVSANEHFVHQEGKQVFKNAVSEMVRVSEEILRRNRLEPSDIDLLVPHQANMRIIEACQEKLGLSSDKVMVNIKKYANTTAATIPSCLAQASDEGRLEKGDLVLAVGFGAGFTWGANLMRWAY